MKYAVVLNTKENILKGEAINLWILNTKKEQESAFKTISAIQKLKEELTKEGKEFKKYLEKNKIPYMAKIIERGMILVANDSANKEKISLFNRKFILKQDLENFLSLKTVKFTEWERKEIQKYSTELLSFEFSAEAEHIRFPFPIGKTDIPKEKYEDVIKGFIIASSELTKEISWDIMM